VVSARICFLPSSCRERRETSGGGKHGARPPWARNRTYCIRNIHALFRKGGPGGCASLWSLCIILLRVLWRW
jgi:hypothetical protein